MTAVGPVCICGSAATIRVDDMLNLCDRCADIIEEEFKNSGFASETSSDADAAVSSPLVPPKRDGRDSFLASGLVTRCATGSRSTPGETDCASISQLDTSFDLTGLDRSATGTGSQSPGEKDCGSLNPSGCSLAVEPARLFPERSPADSDGSASAGVLRPFKVINAGTLSLALEAPLLRADPLVANTTQLRTEAASEMKSASA